MVSKSSRSILPLSIVFILCITSAQCGTRKVITWRNLEEFYEGGWSGTSSLPGAAFSKPSLINSTLAPLDSRVTGGGVWSGDELGSAFRFHLNYTSFEDSENIIEANVTINYYISRWGDPIGFSPCQWDYIGTFCEVIAGPAVEWKTETFNVNVTGAKKYQRFQLQQLYVGEGLYYILNEVSFSYEIDDSEEPTPGPTEDPTPIPTTSEDPNICNESCEYRAIDCHNYYSCIDFLHKRYYTCAEEDGLAFNRELGMCDRMEFVEGCAPPPRGNCEYRPDFNDCSNYYFCPDTFKEELCELRSCLRGLRYSVDEETGIQQCTVPSKAKCANHLNE